FFLYSQTEHRDLTSFPTRRSSDLGLEYPKFPRHVMGLGRNRPQGCTPQNIFAATRPKHIGQIGMSVGKLFDNDAALRPLDLAFQDRKSTRLNSSHVKISYAVFCLK